MLIVSALEELAQRIRKENDKRNLKTAWLLRSPSPPNTNESEEKLKVDSTKGSTALVLAPDHRQASIACFKPRLVTQIVEISYLCNLAWSYMRYHDQHQATTAPSSPEASCAVQ